MLIPVLVLVLLRLERLGQQIVRGLWAMLCSGEPQAAGSHGRFLSRKVLRFGLESWVWLQRKLAWWETRMERDAGEDGGALARRWGLRGEDRSELW